MAVKKRDLVLLSDEEIDSYALGQNYMMPNVLTPDLMCAFTERFLLPFYDAPAPIPDFHRHMWQSTVSDESRVVIIAPRDHGKSTAGTVAETLADICFQCADFFILCSNTEGQAADFLGNIKIHLLHNELLRGMHPGLKLIRDTNTDVVGTIDGSWYFRILARGWNQKFRGTLWASKRPNRVHIDDYEDPDEVNNKETRDKMDRRLLTDILMCGSSYCKYRMRGTTLHEDCILERRFNDTSWVARRYSAHNDDFSKLLFPGKHTVENYKTLLASYTKNGDADLYYREIRSLNIAKGNTLFDRSMFHEMTEDDFKKPMTKYVTIDLAISEKQRADYTVFLMFGICADGFIYILHVERFKASADTPLLIQDTLFGMHDQNEIEDFTFEAEKIDKAIMPYLTKEMYDRHKRAEKRPFVTIRTQPTRNKSLIRRSPGIVARMRAHACRFNKQTEWYPAFEHELLQATPMGVKSRNDDQFSTFVMVGERLDAYVEGDTEEEAAERKVMEYNVNVEEDIRDELDLYKEDEIDVYLN